MRKLNLVFLAGLIVVALVLGVGTYFVHDHQVERNASALVNRAKKLEAEGELSKAAETLKHYLSLSPDDGKTWRWYAQVMDDLYAEAPPRRREQVLLVHEEALRRNPDDQKLERRCAELAMAPELIGEHIGEAKRHLEALDRKLPDGSQGPEKAEIKELRGICLEKESNFSEAEQFFKEAVDSDSTRVSSHRRLAVLWRTELKKDPKEADDQIDRMVLKNPKSGTAYLCRFQFDSQFRPPARESDLQKALEVAPDDPDVLRVAAADCVEKKKLADARAHLEKAARLAPKRPEIAVQLAGLELVEQHPERAEAILREAYKQKPAWFVAFQLAEVLIRQKKITGEGQAEDYLTILRSKGHGSSYGRVLEAEIKMQQGDFAKAINDIEAAQAIFKSLPDMTARLNLLLADCYNHTGAGEQRLAALQNAVAGGADAEGSQLELARALTLSNGPGEVDQALKILRTLADKRPELELEITRLLLRRTLDQPKEQRDWKAVEQQLANSRKLLSSDKKRPEIEEALTLISADVLVAQKQLDKARDLLAAAQFQDRRNPRYRVALSRLALRQGSKTAPLKMLDQAEKELGPSLDLQLGRLDYWAQLGGDQAKVEVAKLAEARKQVPPAQQPVYLERIAGAELRLGEPRLARQHLGELAALQPANLQVLRSLFELAMEAEGKGEEDKGEAESLIDRMSKVENPGDGQSSRDKKSKGTYWRFAQASMLLDQEFKRQQGSNLKNTKPAAERSGKTADIEKARELAEEIQSQRPAWWGGPLLQAWIAELYGRSDEAITGFQRALELGFNRPEFVQHLIGLLSQQGRDDEIDLILGKLSDQDSAPEELKIAKAISAMRRQEYDRGIALARELFENSNKYSDHLTLAGFYANAGKLTEAENEYRQAVEKGPGVPETWLNYVRFQLQTKKPDEAKATVEAARKALSPDRSALPLAQCYMMIGDARQAEASIQTALKEKPTDPAALRLAVALCLAQNRGDEAGKYLDVLVSPASHNKPDDLVFANRARARILLRTGRTADVVAARGMIEKNLKENPKSPQDIIIMASILVVQPKTRGDAVKLLEPLDEEKRLEMSDQFLLAQLYQIERDEKKYQDEMLKILVDGKSTNPQHLGNYIAYLIDHKQLEQAGRWLAELKQAEPNGLAALELEARFLKARNPEGERLPELRDLLVARGRNYPDLIGVVASLLGRYGFPSEAEAAYKEFITRDPSKPERELALASFLATQKGRVSEALNHLAHAWKTCPPEQVAFASLSLFDAPSVTEAQRKQVEAWLSEASQKRPDLVVLSIKLAAIWIRQGRFDEAEALYRRILVGSSENSEALNNLAWLLALRDQSKSEEAIALINRAIDLQGPSASLIDTKGVILIRGGRIKDAIDELKKASIAAPRNPNLQLHLAWAQQSDGKMEEARQAFQKAVTLGWKAERSDPLERSYIDKLRQELGL